MEPIHCTICNKNNFIPEGRVVVLAAFAQKFYAQSALNEMQKAHIIPASAKIFSKEKMAKNNSFLECDTVVIELHGIKDIVQLQALFVESICQKNNALTVDIISSQKSYTLLYQQLS